LIATNNPKINAASSGNSACCDSMLVIMFINVL